MRIIKSILSIFIVILGFGIAHAKEVGPVTGLPLPRFVSLKSNESNLRIGPNVKYSIVWTYKKKGYPMMLVAEFENWRKLKDADGSEGWIHENLITGLRNVVIKDNKYKSTKLKYDKKNNELILFRYPDESSYPMARAEFGTIAHLKKCQKEWCKVRTGNITAWTLKENLWGVFPEEIIE